MNRVAQQPVKAFAGALAAVGVLSVMDALMKSLVIALGIFAVSIWRSLANFGLSAILYLPHRQPWPSRPTLGIHVARSVTVTVMAGLFFWGIGRVPLAQGIALTFIAPLPGIQAGIFSFIWAQPANPMIASAAKSFFMCSCPLQGEPARRMNEPRG